MARISRLTVKQEEVKPRMQDFKQHLQEMMENPDETSAFDAETIRIILEDLSDVDRNVLLVYYGVCDCSAQQTANVFNCTYSTVRNRVKAALNKIIEKNVTPKTRYNQPRECPDN
jgi:DNA-directed RNA polymerase specialized sigma24 family protein